MHVEASFRVLKNYINCTEGWMRFKGPGFFKFHVKAASESLEIFYKKSLKDLEKIYKKLNVLRRSLKNPLKNPG